MKTPHKESPVRKGRFGGGFSDLPVPENTGIYGLLSLGDSGFPLALPGRSLSEESRTPYSLTLLIPERNVLCP